VYLLGCHYCWSGEGQNVAEAVGTAKNFVTKAMAAGFLIGQGHAPLNHRAGFVPERVFRQLTAQIGPFVRACAL